MKKSFLALVLLLPTVLAGSGFRMNPMGIKAMGMGGLATALSQDATAVFYNPAAISKVEQNTITAGFNVMLPYTSYLDPYDGNTDMEVSPLFPFHAYGVYKLKSKFTLGLAINTPYSNKTDWSEDWTGRYIVQESKLKTIYLQPVVAYAFNDHLSIGAGPVVGWAQSERSHAMDYESNSIQYGKAEFKNNGMGFGFSAGLHYIYNNFSAGLNYRSAVKFDLNNGTVNYSDIPDGAVLLEGIPASADYHSEMSMPANIDAGIAYKFNEKFTGTFNFSMAQWADVDSVNYSFNDNSAMDFSLGGSYDNASSFSLGGQYHYNERTWFRAGFALENTPVPSGSVSPASPDADKIIYSGGISYSWKKGMTFDAGIQFENYKTRIEGNNERYQFNGEYKTTVYILGLGLNYAF